MYYKIRETADSSHNLQKYNTSELKVALDQAGSKSIPDIAAGILSFTNTPQIYQPAAIDQSYEIEPDELPLSRDNYAQIYQLQSLNEIISDTMRDGVFMLGGDHHKVLSLATALGYENNPHFLRTLEHETAHLLRARIKYLHLVSYGIEILPYGIPDGVMRTNTIQTPHGPRPFLAFVATLSPTLLGFNEFFSQRWDIASAPGIDCSEGDYQNMSEYSRLYRKGIDGVFLKKEIADRYIIRTSI